MRGLLLLVFILVSNSVLSAELTTEKAQQALGCRLIPERLERLDCFDRAFSTPAQIPLAGTTQERPKAWQLAFSESIESGNFYEGSNDNGDAWLILRPLSASSEPDPVIVMSCLNKISRVEVALPKPIDDGRITLSIGRGSKQSWRSDDEGVVFSSAQGLPAINLMKSIMQKSDFELHSSATVLEGLSFNSSGISSAIKPLRKQCGW